MLCNGQSPIPLKIRYTPVESATCFAFNTLVQKIKKEIHKKHPEITDFNKVNEIIYQGLCAFTINGQKFEFESKNNYLGGCRWFVKCPKCGKPKMHLYMPVKNPEKEQKYYCRNCHALRNVSLLLGNTARYINIIKPLRRLQKLRRKLTSSRISIAKAKPLLEEYERLEKELLASPDYRLWKFQMEHGKGQYTV